MYHCVPVWSFIVCVLQCHLKMGEMEAAVEWLSKARDLPTVTTEVRLAVSIVSTIIPLIKTFRVANMAVKLNYTKQHS